MTISFRGAGWCFAAVRHWIGRPSASDRRTDCAMRGKTEDFPIGCKIVNKMDFLKTVAGLRAVPAS
jgi:hypothetical protein